MEEKVWGITASEVGEGQGGREVHEAHTEEEWEDCPVLWRAQLLL